MNLKPILATGIDIAREAGALLRDGLGQGLSIQQKGTAVDWVTQFDEQAEVLIVERLQTAFPDHGLVAEEGSRANGDSPLTWYIDPLDGTTNFAHGMPIFCVSMALYEGDRPLVGIIYDPMRDECFGGASGQGATLTTPGGTTPLRVSQATELIHSLLATGFPYDRHHSDHDNMRQLIAFLKRAQGIRRNGSAALDMANVAAGRLDGYWEFKLNSWDIAAGVLLVQEAGGQVTLVDGSPFVLSAPVSLIASNGRLHPQMLEILRESST
jgi:myo-inositol-1(or 4)-monophosphatase